MSDSVNHPDHYNTGNIEVIAAIDAWKLGFCLGNAVKYIARAGHKDNAVEDLRKAIWYLHHEIDLLEADKMDSAKQSMLRYADEKKLKDDAATADPTSVPKVDRCALCAKAGYACQRYLVASRTITACDDYEELKEGTAYAGHST